MRENTIILKPNFFNKKKVINNIRKLRFGEDLDKSSISNEIKRYMSIQEKDKEAAANLVKDIYSKRPHFLLELIQNADDNKYNENTEPKLKFTFDDKKIILNNNEIGFNKKNVWAICSIGKTTKKKKFGFIGEKGIGFKSVFKISNTPVIFSNGYQFKFNYNNEYPLSIIKPHWVEKRPNYIKKNETNIILPLKNDVKDEIIDIFQINPLLILFLNKIKKIIIENELEENTEVIEIKPQGKNQLILIKEYNTQSNQDKLLVSHKEEYWRLIKNSFTVPSIISDTEPKRRDINKTELILAFPITKLGNAITNIEQNVHVYLPINSYGFRFIIHGDLLTPPDRERFHEDRKWNIWLRDNVSSVFLNAVNEFKRDETLKKTYYNYIPINNEIQDKLFSPIVDQIHEKLLKAECIFTESNQWRAPNDVFSASKEIRTLISNEEVNSFFEKEFVHPEISIRKGIQTALNIEEFNIDHLFEFLEDEDWKQSKSDEWLVNLYIYLENCGLDYEQEENLLDLKIIRLENNKLVSINDGSIFFPLEEKIKYNFENDLPFLKKNIYVNLPKDENGNSPVKEFLENLGVKKTTPKVLIQDYILPFYKNKQWLNNNSTIHMDHINYIKDHIENLSYNLISDIKKIILLRSNNVNTLEYNHPDDLYLPKEYGNFNNLEMLFKGICEERFIHVQYVKSVKNRKEKVKEWKEFLLEIGVSKFPKVYNYKGSYVYDYFNEKRRHYYKKNNGKKNYIDFETEYWSNDKYPPYVKDWYLSEEFEKILKLEDFERYQLLIQILSENWDKYYSAYNHFIYNWFYFNWRNKDKESSFFRDLKKYLKIPTISNKLLRPSSVFFNKNEIRDILGDSVEYTSVELNKNLMKLLNINTDVDEASIINVLDSLVEDECVDKSDFLKLYRFMNQQFIELSWDVFSKKKLIYIPGTEQKYFSEQEVIWKDVSPIFKTKWPSLRKHYPKLREFFVEKIGIREEPYIKEYVDLLREFVEQGELNSQEEDIILKIYQKLNKYLKTQDINSIEWWEDFVESPIYWTEKNTFWKNDGDLFINDDDMLYNIFKNKEDFTFLKLPRNFHPKVKYFINATNIFYLSKIVKADLLINEKPIFLVELTEKIRTFIPFLKRYLYQFEQEIYKSMKKRTFQRLENLACKSINNLEVEYSLEVSYTDNLYKSKQMRKTFLDDNTLYIQKDNSENFQIISIELMHFLENVRGLDDFLLILFQKKSQDEIEIYLKLKNIYELPESELDKTSKGEAEEVVEVLEEGGTLSIEDELIESDTEDLILEEEILDEELSEDSDLELGFEEEFTTGFEEKEEEDIPEKDTAETKIHEIEKSIKNEEKKIEHKQKRLEESEIEINNRKRLIEEAQNKFDKIKENIQKEVSIDSLQEDLREVEEKLDLVGKSFDYNYDPIELAKEAELEILTSFTEHRIKLPEEREKVINDIKKSKTERNSNDSKKTGFWGEEYVFECLKNYYLELYPDVESEEEDGIFKLLLDNPIIITYNNWGRIESRKPYDMKINEDNRTTYIDVKSTTTNRISPIEITRNELIKMYEQEEYYHIYRVLNADSLDAEIKVIENPIKLWKNKKIIIIPESHSLLYY